MSSARETAKPFGPSCLFPDETEIARLVLGPKRAKAWGGLAVVFERSSLPKIEPMTGGRYWPAVRAFFDARHDVGGELDHLPRPIRRPQQRRKT